MLLYYRRVHYEIFVQLKAAASPMTLYNYKSYLHQEWADVRITRCSWTVMLRDEGDGHRAASPRPEMKPDNPTSSLSLRFQILAFQQLDLADREARQSTAICLFIHQTPREGLVIAGWINAQNPSHVATSLARDAEFSEKVSPLVEPGFHGLADLIFAVLGMVSGAGNRVDYTEALACVLEKNSLQILDCFFRVKTM